MMQTMIYIWYLYTAVIIVVSAWVSVSYNYLALKAHDKRSPSLKARRYAGWITTVLWIVCLAGWFVLQQLAP
jgi:hypothetical protein